MPRQKNIAPNKISARITLNMPNYYLLLVDRSITIVAMTPDPRLVIESILLCAAAMVVTGRHRHRRRSRERSFFGTNSYASSSTDRRAALKFSKDFVRGDIFLAGHRDSLFGHCHTPTTGALTRSEEVTTDRCQKHARAPPC